MSNGYGAYKQTAVMTASPVQILLMLYEAAIKYVKKASIAIDKEDMKIKGESIIKAHDIVIELTTSLDHEKGGKVAEDLEALYNFMTEKLVSANLNNSKEDLAAVQKSLETLLEGWRGAAEKIAKGIADQGTNG
ncbi:MAG: flagellar export chaperone FliS [Bdellovibrionaceae bacterium]|nr:flagellar export chaperone FliS [Pseudobdellovibrionaceae bacterium]|tara:strand:- start:1135 stop:1536 length:402 start_codon:yes stop_codon:yes gene_type:complete